MIYYESYKVQMVPLFEEITAADQIDFSPSINSVLEFVAGRSIKDQIYMLANLLTISGFTQKEIADGLGTTHCAYRDRLREIRKDFKHKGLNEL
jgi:hypothetical protein